MSRLKTRVTLLFLSLSAVIITSHRADWKGMAGLPSSSFEAAAYRMGLAPRSVGWPAMALEMATDAPMGSDLSVLAYSGAFVMPGVRHTH